MAKKFKETVFYQDWLTVKEQMEPMSAWEKLGHLWYCYKVYILFFGGCFLALGVILGSFISYQSQEELVSGMLVNLDMKQAGLEYLREDYSVYLGAEKNQLAGLEYTHFGPLDDPLNAEENYSQALVVIARVEGQMLDYILLDKAGMETFVVYDIYQDLREFFTEAELAEFDAQDRVKYAQYEGETDKRPIAIDVSDVPFIRNNIEGEEEGVYFAISGHNPDMEMCRTTWDYIHDWKE